MSDFKPINYRPSDLNSPFGIFQAFVSQYLGSRLALLQPVEIVSTDGQFATVRPLLAHFDTTGQKIPITAADNISNIPIVQPFGGNGQIKFEPSVGDKGLLIACNWDISAYKKTHAQTTVASSRQFNWSDGFFLPVDFSAAPVGTLIQNGASSVQLDKNEINISTGTTNLSSDLVITGNITVNGTITATGEVTGNNIKLSTHMHGTPQANAVVTQPVPPQSTAPIAGT